MKLFYLCVEEEHIGAHSLASFTSVASLPNLRIRTSTVELTADIQITWPDGLSQSFQGIAANEQYRLGYPTDPQAEEAQRLALYGRPSQQPEPAFYPSNLELILAALLISLIVVTLVWLWRR